MFEMCNVGLDSAKFSIEMHHGGFFAGSGLNVRYLDGSIAWFDNLDRTQFGQRHLDYMISLLGYQRSDCAGLFWCPPGNSIDEMTAVNCKKMS